MSLTVLEVIERAQRLIGSIAAGDDPTADEAADALVSYNAMQRSLFGTLIGPRVTPATAAVNLTGETGRIYVVGSATITLTLPLNPRAGARVGVVDGNAGLATFSTTVARNGRLLEGAASNVVLSTAGTTRTWFYRPDTADWVREADQALADTPYFHDSLIAYLPYMLAVELGAEYGAEIRPDVVGMMQQGRAAFARIFARRGRNQMDPPLGVTVQGTKQGS